MPFLAALLLSVTSHQYLPDNSRGMLAPISEPLSVSESARWEPGSSMYERQRQGLNEGLKDVFTSDHRIGKKLQSVSQLTQRITATLSR